MSDNLKIANVDEDVLEYKLINDIRLADSGTPTAIVDVTQESGTLYYLSLDTSSVTTSDQALKLYLSTTEVTVGTTAPDVQIFVPHGTRLKMSCPAGLPFTGFSASLLTQSINAGTSNSRAGAGQYSILNVVTS
tara:strand:+ start:1365 stop:1766 length:402 start_codon:yes stop_codon:yes gene_type:complete